MVHALERPEQHPAAVAWVTSHPARRYPESIVRLKEGAKTGVYRLIGVERAGSVIAQRMRRRRWQLERSLYEKVFANLPVSTLRCYGSVEGLDGQDGWLFLEDAGEERLSFAIAEHRELAVRWLGLLHTAGARNDWQGQLPDRGPDEYLNRVRAVRRELVLRRQSDAAAGEPTAILQSLVDTIDVLQTRWNDLVSPCAGLPRTIVHRDFQEKNLRVHLGKDGLRLLAFDWATAGVGLPPADLGGRLFTDSGSGGASGPDVYLSVVQQSWPHLTREELLYYIFVGRVFRLILMIDWEWRRRGRVETLSKYGSSLARRLREGR